MAPKKKGNKGHQDDWEAELGETIVPSAPVEAAENANENNEEAVGGGGLMAMLRKNKEKRKKKGIDDEESAPQDPAENLTDKAPVEANLDDEFALPGKKGKGGAKGKQAVVSAKNGADDEALDNDGRVLTKAEKEKLKKEREKQRKKEQVSHHKQ